MKANENERVSKRKSMSVGGRRFIGNTKKKKKNSALFHMNECADKYFHFTPQERSVGLKL